MNASVLFISLSPVIGHLLCVQVRSLEAANRKLELQIREFYEKRAPAVSTNFSAYFTTISEIRAQVPLTFWVILQIMTRLKNCIISKTVLQYNKRSGFQSKPTVQNSGVLKYTLSCFGVCYCIKM